MSEFKLVPASMLLDKETIGAINFHCGDGSDGQFGEYSDGLLWVGTVTDDDGKEVYGLHLATAEYPEEGSTTLIEFAVPVATSVDVSEVERLTAERDALQLRLNAADQRIDELTQRQGEPVSWGAPKTVNQLIRQLQTLDPELETHAMLRIPDFKDGKQVRSCPLSISYERMEGSWLSSFKGDGRKVIAFWAKPDPRDLQDQGETLTEAAES